MMRPRYSKNITQAEILQNTGNIFIWKMFGWFLRFQGKYTYGDGILKGCVNLGLSEKNISPTSSPKHSLEGRDSFTEYHAGYKSKFDMRDIKNLVNANHMELKFKKMIRYI